MTTVLGDKFEQFMSDLMRLFFQSCQFLPCWRARTATFVPLYVDFLIDPNLAPVNLSHEGLTKAEAEIRL
jgi:hypothetical protein